MQLVLVEDNQEFARMVIATFVDICWVHIERPDVIDRFNEVDGYVVDLHLGASGDSWDLIREVEEPCLLLTGDESLDVVRRAQELEIELAFKTRWQEAIERLKRQIEEGVDYRVRSFARSHGLTAREREVLELFVADFEREEIAEQLAISPRTVRAHLRSILLKSGLTRLSDVRRRVRRGARGELA